MKRLLGRKISIVLLIVQIIFTIGLIGTVIYVGIIPLKYILILSAVLVFFLLYGIFSQMTASKVYLAGRVLCVLICLFYAGGVYYCVNTNSAIEEISNSKQTKVSEISCVVLKDDEAQSIYDTTDYTYGILGTSDRENTDAVLADVKTAINKDPEIKEYNDNDALVDALYAKEVQVIVLNEANRALIEDVYDTFRDDTRVLDTTKVEKEIEVEEKLDDITTTPFIVYLSGIDLYGDINQTSRSDVNVLAVVNPNTKRILLVSTPRDYYVELPGVSNGMCDKLTHAGIHGVDCSIRTLENVYNVDIDYYVRVNFTSIRKIVNVLGGVDVYSDYTFTSDWGPSFKKGYNHVNGKQALAFCRERHHFENGDYQRGRDHQHMIEAILTKAMSAEVLPKYAKLLRVTSERFQTNMSMKEMKALCKMQLRDMADWTIKYANADGNGAMRTTYAYQSRPLYVCLPDYDSVEKITKRIKKVLSGDTGDLVNKGEDKAQASPSTAPAAE